MKTTSAVFCVCGTLIFTGVSAQANTVQVQEVITSPTETISGSFPVVPSNGGVYNGAVYAGVVNLNVDGVATTGFCIDPFHFSNPSSVTAAYNVVNLQDAPKPPGPMGAPAALEIEKLWGYVYSLGANITAENAAGLQIAIWDVVAAATHQTFTLATGQTDYHAQDFINHVTDTGYDGPVADLVGLTSVDLEHGQDYVVRSVPDGGATLGLLGFGFASLALARSRKNTKSQAAV
jgi:hypothetical protein